jgi:Flp pilus assembly protein TadD
MRSSLWRPQPWLLAAVLAALTLLVFRPALDLPFRNLDDADYVTENPHVTAGLTVEGLRWAAATAVQGHWHPATMLSLMLDVSLFGVRADWMHFVNVALHCASAALLFLALAEASGEAWPSLLAAALFAFHPMRVESVAWVSERKDVLCVFFCMLCLRLYVAWAKRRLRPAFALSHAAFVAAMLSKATAVTMPFCLLLFDAWPLRRLRKETAVERVKEKAGFFALSAVFAAAAFVAQRHVAMRSLDDLPLATRLAHWPVAYLLYLWKTFLPVDLPLFYPYRRASPAEWLGALALLGIVTYAAWRARRKAPGALVGWLWFLGTLVPMIGLVQLGGQGFANRYSYLPHAGLAFALAFSAAALARRIPRLRIALAAAGLLSAVGCAWATRVDFRGWKDLELMYRRTLDVAPEHFHIRNLLAIELMRKGDLRGAEREFRTAIASLPSYAEGRANLALLLAREGRGTEALAQSAAAVQLQPGNASFREDFALLLDSAGRQEEARREYERSIEESPTRSSAHSNLGGLLFRMGRPAEAEREFREALRFEPENADAHNNLGIALAADGRRKEAVAEFAEALKLRPGFVLARRNLELAARPDVKAGFTSSLLVR